MQISDESTESYDARGQAQLRTAPQQFLEALGTIGQMHPNDCLQIFAAVASMLEREGSSWAGAAYCCCAYCLKDLERYEEAIAVAERGKQLGLNLIGAWYYHDVVVHSLNLLDDLPGALRAAEAAVKFFSDERSPINVSVHLGWKANLLKQMASHLSRQEQSRAAAKSCITQAIQAICESFLINDEGLEDSAEELDAMARIAGRVGVRAADLNFPNAAGPQISPIREKYFNDLNLRRLAATESFNESVSARKNGDRQAAVVWLRRAVESVPEETDEDRAFKIFLAYQQGVNLLKLHGLESYHPARRLSAHQLNAAEEIRNVWKECLRLYPTINEKHLSQFNERYANLTDAIRNIRHDPLMQG